MLSHIKSRSEYDYSLFKQQKNLNSLPYHNILTPVLNKETFRYNIQMSNNQLKKNNNVIQKNQIKTLNKFYSESEKKISQSNFLPSTRNINKCDYFINGNNQSKTEEIKINNIPLQKNNKENINNINYNNNNNNTNKILINLMKTPLQQSYRLQNKKQTKIHQNLYKENLDQNINNNHIINQNLNKIKVNFLSNLKKKQFQIQISKSLHHNSSSYNIPKRLNKPNQINKKHINNNINTTNSTINNSNYDDEYFENIEEKIIELTKEEKEIYGKRNMENYKKIKLLGKGGCGIVWLCNSNLNNNLICAVKQISKKNNFAMNNDEIIQIGRNEIKILENLNENNGNDKIPKLYNYYEDNFDIWFSFEKGGQSLSNLSFKIKGEFINNERIYCIQKGKFFQKLFSNIKEFKILSKNIIEGIDYINNKGYIHSDIKPENILIDYEENENDFHIKNVKIIDFGSSFNYKNITSEISSNTPEYLCPEITSNNKNFYINLSKNEKYINSIDIWSIGITLLELCLACPIWMSYKAKVIINGKSKFTTGLFGYRGRDSNKIYHKQIELCKNLEKILKGSFIYSFNKDDKDNFIDLLEKMLCFDYKNRINTKDALVHKFFS